MAEKNTTYRIFEHISDVDISEQDIMDYDPAVLDKLLIDHTMSAKARAEASDQEKVVNIFWATSDYENSILDEHGNFIEEGYRYDDEIKPEHITGRFRRIVMPRVLKDKQAQLDRTKDKAEVFTPSWVCNAQNNLIDENWFGRKDVFNREITNEDGTHSWIPSEGKIQFPEGNKQKTWKKNQVEEYVNFTKRTALVQEYYPSQAEIDLYQQVSDYLMREGTYGVPERQRPLLSLLVRKIMSSSAYALGYTLERFIHRLEVYKETGMMSSALDCVTNDYDNKEDEYDIYDKTSSESNSYFDDIDAEIAELQGYCDLARSIGEETKSKELLNALSVSFEKIKSLGGQKKALIFTESRRTQEYLYKYLSEHGYKDKVICFNGTNTSEDAKNIYRLWLMQYAGTNRISGSTVIDRKQAIVDTFRDKAEILIATEAGAEGINLQFCSLVVNYDMPWNPQRIEQRIGRCHRYGQKSDVVVVNFVNEANYADRRVYELLNDKFSLFDGVFGASDEVLGSIDSGVDFERRLNSIYSTCRTEREIAAAFDELQNELEEVIKERIACTRKSLLENFDEEVVNKLRMRQSEDSVRLDTYNKHLWHIAVNVLKDSISNIDSDKHIFTLNDKVASNIPTDTYILNKESEQYIQLRYGHPLGKFVVEKALAEDVSDEELVFDLDSYPYKTALIEQYKGQSGLACVYRVTSSNQYDGEEQLIACAKTDGGEILPPEFVFKLLELDCLSQQDSNLATLDDIFKEEYEEQLNGYKFQVEERTNEYVDYEINKYEMWAEDQLVPLRKEVMELNKEHEALRRQIRKEHNASVKIQLKKAENTKAKLLSKKRAQLFQLEDEYANKVDSMTSKLQSSMENSISSKIMFRLKWTIK